MNDVAIKATNLVKKCGDFVAVDHLSFEVNKGEIFGFLGPNGAGKTTTIRMLCTLSSPTEGSATVAGFDIAHQGNRVHPVTLMSNVKAGNGRRSFSRATQRAEHPNRRRLTRAVWS